MQAAQTMSGADCGFPTPPPDSFEGKPKTRAASGNHPLTFGFWRWGPLHRVSPTHTQLQGALGPMSGHQYGGSCLFGRASWQSELNDGLGTGSFQEQLFNGPLLSSHLSSLLVNTDKHVSGESRLLFHVHNMIWSFWEALQIYSFCQPLS